MRSAEYEAYLASPTWQEKRAEALERAEHRCQLCNSAKRLDVHHRTYERFGGEELPGDLTVLCRRCHNHFHAKPRQKGKARSTKRKPVTRRASGPIQQDELEALWAAMVVPNRSYSTKELAQATSMKLGRAGMGLAAMRKAGRITRRGKAWRRPYGTSGPTNAQEDWQRRVHYETDAQVEAVRRQVQAA